MIKKYGDAQPITIIDDPDKFVKKSSEDQEDRILKFQEEQDVKKNKTER